MGTSGDEQTAMKTMRLRYSGACDLCAAPLEAGARAAYLKATRSVRCLACLERVREVESAPTLVDPISPDEAVNEGRAGASARREFERRAAKREARIREAHPRLGGLILALSEDPQSTTAWASGARGEEVLGARLDDLTGKGVRVLHDRRIPRTKANIDHVVVGPTGVHVIDAKRYAGRRPSLRVEGGLFRPRVEKLMVGSRDCARLVDGVHRQVSLVRAALVAADLPDVPVQGSLCFVDGDWPLLGGAFLISDVAVLWPKRLAQRITAPGPLSEDDVVAAHRALAHAFPAA